MKEQTAMLLARRSYSHYMVDEPNTWKPLGRADGKRSASYVCPNGHVGSLLDHEIAPDGTVNPSVVCEGYPKSYRAKNAPAEPCTFHDHLKLEGWEV